MAQLYDKTGHSHLRSGQALTCPRLPKQPAVATLEHLRLETGPDVALLGELVTRSVALRIASLDGGFPKALLPRRAGGILVLCLLTRTGSTVS